MAGYKRFKCFRETFLKRRAEHQRCKSWNVKRRALDKHKGRMKLSTGTRKAHEKPMKSARLFSSLVYFLRSIRLYPLWLQFFFSQWEFWESFLFQSVSVLSLLLPGGRTRGCLRGASIVGSGKSIANDFEKTDPLVQGWQDNPRTGIVFHSQQRDWSMNVSRIFWLSFQSFLTWDSKDFQVSESGFTQITQIHLDLYATPMALLPIFVSSLHPISASCISSFLPTWHLFSAGSWSSRSYARNVRRRRGEQYWCCELNALNALRVSAVTGQGFPVKCFHAFLVEGFWKSLPSQFLLFKPRTGEPDWLLFESIFELNEIPGAILHHPRILGRNGGDIGDISFAFAFICIIRIY